MSIYGTRLFGKVDAVPGLGHVAVKCFHINFVPLIPTQGWLVTSQSGNGWRGMKIPISLKSYGVAWGRTLSVLAIILGVVFAIVGFTDPRRDMQFIGVSGGVAVAGLLVYVALKKASFVNRASYARACQLAKLAKLPDGFMVELAKAYGEAPVSYGFSPKAPPALPKTAAVAPIDEPIPVEGDEDSEAPEPAVAAAAAAPIRPLSESRRHG